MADLGADAGGSRWWRRPGAVERVDLATRWQLYAMSASEPLAVALQAGARPGMGTAAAGGLIAAAITHAVLCIALLRSGIAHLLGGRRPSPRLVLVAVSATCVVVAAGLIGGAPGAALLACAGLVGAAAPLVSAGRLAALVAVGAIAAGAVQVSAGGTGISWAMTFLSLVGAIAVTYRSSVWFLDIVHELDRAAHVRARLAVAEERLRFARDLHDVLGRDLGVVAVTSELAAKLVGRDPEAAVRHMQDVRRRAQDSLTEVRAVARGYRGADLDTELAGARSLLRSAGIRARVVGDGEGLPPPVQAALGWVVREATTNVLRHSEPTAVRIDVEVRSADGAGATAVLRVENDGVRAPGASGRSDGTGLAGLRERLGGLGGALSAGPRGGGRFLVEARLPVTPRGAP